MQPQSEAIEEIGIINN